MNTDKFEEFLTFLDPIEEFKKLKRSMIFLMNPHDADKWQNKFNRITRIFEFQDKDFKNLYYNFLLHLLKDTNYGILGNLREDKHFDIIYNLSDIFSSALYGREPKINRVKSVLIEIKNEIIELNDKNIIAKNALLTASIFFYDTRNFILQCALLKSVTDQYALSIDYYFKKFSRELIRLCHEIKFQNIKSIDEIGEVGEGDQHEIK